MTIKGTALSGPTVTFGGAVATLGSHTASTIVATVPAAAATGPVVVKTKGGSVTAGTFTVTTGIALSTTSGEPGTVVTVSGAGFGSGEAVDVYIGTTDAALVFADSAGRFTKTGLRIPADAQPGTTWVSAVGRKTESGGQAGFVVHTDWPQAAFSPSMSSSNPYEDTLDSSSARTLDTAWTAKSTSTENFGEPAVVGGVVYVGADSGSVYAYDAATGGILWAATADGAANETLAVIGSTVYVASANAITAFAAATGTPKWAVHPSDGSHPIGGVTVADGLAFAVTSVGNVFAVDITTGTQKWLEPLAPAGTVSASVSSPPAVVGNVVYAEDSTKQIGAWVATTGQPLWSVAANASSGVALSGERLFVGTGNSLSALDADTGATLWTTPNPTGNGVLVSTPAVAGGTVYSADGSNVLAFDAASGAVAWSTTSSRVSGGHLSVANGLVYVAQNFGIVVYDAVSGARVAGLPLLQPYGSPVVADGRVYAGGNLRLRAWSIRGEAPPASVAPNRLELHRTER